MQFIKLICFFALIASISAAPTTFQLNSANRVRSAEDTFEDTLDEVVKLDTVRGTTLETADELITAKVRNAEDLIINRVRDITIKVEKVRNAELIANKVRSGELTIEKVNNVDDLIATKLRRAASTIEGTIKRGVALDLVKATPVREVTATIEETLEEVKKVDTIRREASVLETADDLIADKVSLADEQIANNIRGAELRIETVRNAQLVANKVRSAEIKVEKVREADKLITTKAVAADEVISAKVREVVNSIEETKKVVATRGVELSTLDETVKVEHVRAAEEAVEFTLGELKQIAVRGTIEATLEATKREFETPVVDTVELTKTAFERGVRRGVEGSVEATLDATVDEVITKRAGDKKIFETTLGELKKVDHVRGSTAFETPLDTAVIKRETSAELVENKVRFAEEEVANKVRGAEIKIEKVRNADMITTRVEEGELKAQTVRDADEVIAAKVRNVESTLDEVLEKTREAEAREVTVELTTVQSL